MRTDIYIWIGMSISTLLFFIKTSSRSSYLLLSISIVKQMSVHLLCVPYGTASCNFNFLPRRFKFYHEIVYYGVYYILDVFLFSVESATGTCWFLILKKQLFIK